MIRLNVFVQAETDKYAEAVAVARLLAEESQKEVGCIAYDVFQSVTRGDVFMICETWESPEALQRHSATEHCTKLLPKLQELAAVKLEQFDFPAK